MSKKLCTLANGDDVYLYDKSIVIFFNGKRKVLSTSVYNGGYHEDFKAVYNYDAKQGSGMPCESLADTYIEHMKLISQRLAIEPEMVSGMATAASMENAAVETMSYKDLTVTAIVTAGIEHNGGRAGDYAAYYMPAGKPGNYGTINIMLALNCDLPPGTLTRALVTCMEAKTAALQELLAGSCYSNGIATGSGTDQAIIIANAESNLYFEDAGKHSKLGELIGKTVIKAVKRALNLQNGLNAEFQHNAFRRLKRFGVTPDKLWQDFKQINTANLLKPQYLLAAEELACDDFMLTYTSLYIHLLDQSLWQLLNEKEAVAAAQNLLNILSAHYSVENIVLSAAGEKTFIDSWQQLFNNIVGKRICDSKSGGAL